MKAPLLTTDRLRLVPLVKDDAPQIQAVFPQWEIVRHLARVEQATCGELDGGRPKSTVSHHFKVLREAGLVPYRREWWHYEEPMAMSEVRTRYKLLDF